MVCYFQNFAEFRGLREQYLERQRKAYFNLLEPQIKILTALQLDPEEKEKEIHNVIEKVKSFEGRKSQFELYLIGTDGVIRANNKFWQHLYKRESDESIEDRGKDTLRLFGDILLEIRKSLGNKKTKLDSLDMLQFLIKDINKLKR